LLEEWWDAFGIEIGEQLARGSGREAIATRLAGRQIFLWKNANKIVSMAAWAGPTPNGVRINLVYTPREHRNRGYASANVAALSRHLLDSGKKFCFLFTDLANPTSNSIYRKIGYRCICNWIVYNL
jgi:predicted GNAT family acetyltransferase